jgi:hypothetical protein
MEYRLQKSLVIWVDQSLNPFVVPLPKKQNTRCWQRVFLYPSELL